MNNAKYLLLFFLLTISFIVKSYSKTKYPDTVVIYYLYTFRNSLLGVSCDNIKKMYDVKEKKIVSAKKARKAYKLFSKKSNFAMDTSINELDVQVLIDFKYKNSIIKSVCWSRIGRIQMDGVVYICNKEIEDFLLSNSLIIKVVM